MNRPKHIDDLPPEMICELFKHLQLKDLFVCSMVNKRWRSIYAAFKVSTLVVLDAEFDQITKWGYPDRKFEDHQLCDPELFSRLADQPLLSNLKRLALLCGWDRFDVDKLQSFSQLVHLEVSCRLPKLNLNLSELEVLVSRRTNFDPLSIDCPKLRVLVYDEYRNASLLNVKNPETIRELKTNMFGPKLAPFKSVERLVTREIGAISRSTLQSLPKLKELRYNESIADAFWQFKDASGTLNRMKRTLSEFLDDVKALRRYDFQFRFVGFQLSKTMLDQIDVQVEGGRETVCNESVYLKNYQLIERDALHFITKLDYTRLLSNVTGELPACFFQKFAGVDEVLTTAAVEDAGHFRWFLVSLRSLRSLWLDRSELGQEFYDQLPKCARSLLQLSMSAYDKRGQLMSFDFLRKFPRLNLFSIYQHLSFETIESLISLFEDLDDVEVYFRFGFNGRSVSVTKTRYDLWLVFDGERDREVMSGNLEDLLDCLEKLQNELL